MSDDMREFIVGSFYDTGFTVSAVDKGAAREKVEMMFENADEKVLVDASAFPSVDSSAETVRRAVEVALSERESERQATLTIGQSDSGSVDESDGDADDGNENDTRNIEPGTCYHVLMTLVDVADKPVTTDELLDAYNAYDFNASKVSGQMTPLWRQYYVARVTRNHPYEYDTVYDGKRFIEEHGYAYPPKDASIPADDQLPDGVSIPRRGGGGE